MKKILNNNSYVQIINIVIAKRPWTRGDDVKNTSLILYCLEVFLQRAVLKYEKKWCWTVINADTDLHVRAE